MTRAGVNRGQRVLRQDPVADVVWDGKRLDPTQARLREMLGDTGIVGWRSRMALAAEIKRRRAAEKREREVK